jgi:hypothetical protein
MDDLVHGVEPKSRITRLNGSLVVRASTRTVPLPRRVLVDDLSPDNGMREAEVGG